MKARNLTLVALAVVSTGCTVQDGADAIFVDGIGRGLQEVQQAIRPSRDRAPAPASTVVEPAPVAEPAPTASAPVASVIVMPALAPTSSVRPAPSPVPAVVAPAPELPTVQAPEPVVVPEPEPEPEPEVIVISNIEEAHAEQDANGHTDSVSDEELVLEMNAFTVEEVAEIIEDETQTTDFPTFVDFDASIRPDRDSWADSYSVGDRCYIIVTGNGLDHGIGDVIVDTPYGDMSVAMVAQTLGQHPDGIDAADARYNTVQCGHGPDNGMWDEKPGACPGRVDGQGGGCGEIGPRWHFDL